MVARVGPVSAKFKGKLALSDLDPPQSYSIAFEGQGGAAGFAKGGAKVSLSQDGDGTLLDHSLVLYGSNMGNPNQHLHHDVPHVLVGGRSFHEREEVLALRNALVAIEWPDDELRVFATLHGPLFALSDGALLAYRQRVGRFHALRRLDADALAKLEEPEREVAEALHLLGELHRRRNLRPIAETLSRLLEALRAHAGIAIWPTGEQALANCLRVLDLARRFERGGAVSFRSFVEGLEDQAERGEAQDAPVVEEGTEGVRIMTVHAAKGLEFPVVILVDPTANRTPAQPSRHADLERNVWAEPLCGYAPLDLIEAADDEQRRDDAEAVRLIYVATTRARDLLVVPGVGDVQLEGWLDVLDPVVHPEPSARRTSEPAPGCPALGEDSVLDRPDNAQASVGNAVKPGSHRPRAGTHRVVWWDPRALELDRDEELGVRQQKILEADLSGDASSSSERAHSAWQASRREALVRGAVPSVRASAVTELVQAPEAQQLARDASLAAIPVAHEQTSVARATRPGGKRFGVLVHAVLASVDPRADVERIRLVASSHARLLRSSDDEIDAAVESVRAALAHPLLARAAEAAARGELHREIPLALRLESGEIAEGVADLAIREIDPQGGKALWIVVDFKTDRELAEHPARYETQLRIYARAIERATGETARAVLLRV